MRFNNHTTVYGRVIKSYELPLEEVEEVNELYEKEKENLFSHAHILAGRIKSELEFSNLLPKIKIYKKKPCREMS